MPADHITWRLRLRLEVMPDSTCQVALTTGWVADRSTPDVPCARTPPVTPTCIVPPVEPDASWTLAGAKLIELPTGNMVEVDAPAVNCMARKPLSRVTI